MPIIEEPDMDQEREFDPTRDVPQNDEEAIAALTHGLTDPALRDPIIAIFQERRASGEGLYQAALSALGKAVRELGARFES